MGLDLSGAPNKEYNAGYGGLHLVRGLALRLHGFPKKITYPAVYVVPEGLTGEDISDAYHAAQIAGHLYPNLLLHSDCDGTYTKTGKVLAGEGENTWLSGNSIGLLEELKILENAYPKKERTGRAWEAHKMLREFFEDALRNGNGTIKFI